MYNTNDNIVALATTPGKSALNVIRVSGPSVVGLLQKITFKNFKPKPNYCYLKKILNPKSQAVLDQGVVVFFKGPKSYTGQDLIEFSVHGGSIVAQKIINTVINIGARQALPGEFSYRAFVNGKIDLIQAEAIASIINTNSDLNAYYAAKNLVGGLSVTFNGLRKSLLNVIAYMEHELDFDENEIEFKKFSSYAKQIKKIQKKINSLLDSSFLGTEKDSNVVVCIAGKTNVGKSSLFNAICGYEKAIVTSVAGTTRDVVENVFTFEDLSVNLVDTAGVRKGGGKIEKMGIQKTFKVIEKSDVVLFVDNKNPKLELNNCGLNLKNKSVFLVQNKIDKYKKNKDKNIYYTSCTKNIGIDFLSTSLSTHIKEKKELFLRKNNFIITKRVDSVLLNTQKTLNKVVLFLNKKNPDLVLVVSSLYVALDFLNDVLSPANKDEIINKIFGDFCVGK